jgi:hypothetical protein
MRILTLIFFHGYVWLLILAGGAGAFSARYDHRLLFSLNVSELSPQTAASLLSQYRFLRAIECGFGIFAFVFRREIFQQRLFNRVFLGTMFFGVAARIVSILLDGQPFMVFHGFLILELIGGILIFLTTRNTLSRA